MVFYFAAIARNIGANITAFQLYIGSILEEFPESRLFIYENNSTDTTKHQLQMWAALNSRVIVKCEDVSQEEIIKQCKAQTMENKPCRMESIAYARNKLMELIEQTDIGSKDQDRIIMIDPDLPVLMDSNDLITILKSGRNDYDALFANGISQRGNYYDVSAYYDMYYPFGLELLSEKTVFEEKYKAVIQKIPKDVPSIPVISAFGGIGIYRASAIRGLRYSGIVTEDVHTVFSDFCKKYPGHPWVQKVKEKPQTHLDGALLGIYLYDKELFYKNNSGYNYPVICEHVPFHAAMICKGYSRLFVEPSLVYVSDHWE